MTEKILFITHDKYYKLLRKIGIDNTPKSLLPLLPYIPDVNVEKLYYNDSKVQFTQNLLPRKQWDTIIISNRSIRPRNDMVPLLKNIRSKADRLIYFDMGDAVGNLSRNALEIADKYWKKHLLSDKKEYLKNYYHDNPYADLYSDKENEFPRIKEKHLNKVEIAWNLGMADHYLYTKNSQKILRKLGFSYNYPSFINPNKVREHDVNVRMKVSGYPKTYVEKHRKKLLEELNPSFKTTPADTVSKEEYLKELADSKIVISPFGNGAICYRDFEAIIAGATLVKPDMSHVETWPDIYEENKTYVPVSWTFDDVNEKINNLLENEEKRKRISKNAQEKYQDYYGKKGINTLKKRFEGLLID